MQMIAATEFKAKCLDLLDRVGGPDLDALGITKHGRVVAMLVPAPAEAASIESLHGFLRSSVRAAGDIDLTTPVLDDPFSAAEGMLHR